MLTPEQKAAWIVNEQVAHRVMGWVVDPIGRVYPGSATTPKIRELQRMGRQGMLSVSPLCHHLHYWSPATNPHDALEVAERAGVSTKDKEPMDICLEALRC